MTLQEKIESAYNTKALFFKPWIGKQYDEGILFSKDRARMKVLIIGASRYCKEIKKKGFDACAHWSSCLNRCDFDSLVTVTKTCAFVQSMDHEGLLADINKASVLKHISGAYIEKTYQTFEKQFRPYTDCKSAANLWNHISFINYLQCCVPEEETPHRSSSAVNEQIFEKSKVIVEKTIALLRPDLVILWGSQTIWHNMHISISKKDHSCSRLFSNCTMINNKVFLIRIEDNDYPLMLTDVHPSSRTRKFEIRETDFKSFIASI